MYISYSPALDSADSVIFVKSDASRSLSIAFFKVANFIMSSSLAASILSPIKSLRGGMWLFALRSLLFALCCSLFADFLFYKHPPYVWRCF
jgi:hypothetical protein